MALLPNQDARLTVSFENYDSTNFPTFPQSIAHAKVNPLLIENLSDWREVNFDVSLAIVQEPSCLFRDVLDFFDEVLEEVEVPESEFYRPEMTAKRLYGSADLWFVLLLVNNIQTVIHYDKPTILYIPGRELTRLEKFAKRAKQTVRTIDEDNTEVII